MVLSSSLSSSLGGARELESWDDYFSWEEGTICVFPITAGTEGGGCGCAGEYIIIHIDVSIFCMKLDLPGRERMAALHAWLGIDRAAAIRPGR